MDLRSERDTSLLYVDWWLMNHCSYSCSYCADIIKNGSIDLPNIKDCLDVVPKIADLARTQGKSTDWNLTGGEVTEWPFLTDLTDSIRAHGGRVKIRTNANLAIDAWREIMAHVDSVLMEFHAEHTLTSHFLLCIQAARDLGVHVSVMASMLPERWDECEAMIAKINKLWPEVWVMRRMLFQDPAINLHPMEYRERQLALFRSQYKNLALGQEPNIEMTNYQTLVLEERNQFLDHKCWIGVEQMIIDAWGRIYRGHCRVGGPIGRLGGEFKPPQDPTHCHSINCGNAFDIMATKRVA